MLDKRQKRKQQASEEGEGSAVAEDEQIDPEDEVTQLELSGSASKDEKQVVSLADLEATDSEVRFQMCAFIVLNSGQEGVDG